MAYPTPMDGECIKETFYIMQKLKNPLREGQQPPSDITVCCGTCSDKVFVDPEAFPNDPTRNDISGPHWFIDDPVLSATLSLEKWRDGVWELASVLTDNSYGRCFKFGDFKNGFNQHFIGIEIDWKLAQADFGYGSYRVTLEYTNLEGTAVLMSNEYCLEKYSDELVEETVKFEWHLNGILGVNTADYQKRDYEEINWYDSVRLPGVFWYLKSVYEKDYTRYNNGERNWVLDEQEPDFRVELQQICWNFHELLRTDMAQSDDVRITDYNKNNVAVWTQKDVQLTGEYAPNWSILRSRLASVTLEFRQRINNLKKRRC